MGSFVRYMRALALTLGAPGLFLLALLDSSILSLPEAVDILLIVMVARDKSQLALLVVSATVGSLGGCLVLYSIGRKGGSALVRKRVAGPRVEQAMAAFQRYGIMAVLIPSMLPAPAPFKVFVLLAGVAGISTAKFSIAVLIGRGLRYLLLGLLAYEFGDRATAYMRDHGVAVSLLFVGVLAAGLAGYLLWKRSRRGRGRQGTPT
jgi:membrane protein YqaA with SNARE-associated domain